MYLERRWRTWFALHDVPAEAQKSLGTPGKPLRRFVASLKTHNRDIAQARAAILEAKWRMAIERAKRGGAVSIEEQAAFYRSALKDAPAAEREALMGRLTDEAERIAYEVDGVPYHYADPGEDAEAREGYQAGLKLIGLATGELIKLDEKMSEYLATLAGKIEEKTIDMARSTLHKFCSEFTYGEDVTPKAVQQWIGRQAQAGKAVPTIQRSLGDLRGYWRYLQSIEAMPDTANPFDKLTLPKRDRRSDKENERRPFTAADVSNILAETLKRKDVPLADLISLAMWTGARREELCALKVAKVNLSAGYIEIADAKTAAGWRQVPVHSKLAPTLKRLLKASNDGYVLSDLGSSKYGDRGNAVGTRFGRLKRELGYGEQYVFHSIRKTVATLLEDAGVPENVAADILGHEKPRITYGLYSGGTSLKTKREAIEKLSYR